MFDVKNREQRPFENNDLEFDRFKGTLDKVI